MRQPRVFTEEEKILILSLYSEGNSTSIIANRFGTSTNKVSEYLKSQGISFRRSGRKQSSTPKRKVKVEDNKEVKTITTKSKKRMKSNLLSMSEEYNIDKAKQLQELINMDVIPNAQLKGVKVDLAIPLVGMVVVSCPTENQFMEWKKNVDGFILGDILRENHYSSVDRLYMGEELISNEVTRRYNIINRFGKK